MVRPRSGVRSACPSRQPGLGQPCCPAPAPAAARSGQPCCPALAPAATREARSPHGQGRGLRPEALPAGGVLARRTAATTAWAKASAHTHTPSPHRPGTGTSGVGGRHNSLNDDLDSMESSQALSGFIAASDQHAATPNATLVGNRARMRCARVHVRVQKCVRVHVCVHVCSV